MFTTMFLPFVFTCRTKIGVIYFGSTRGGVYGSIAFRLLLFGDFFSIDKKCNVIFTSLMIYLTHRENLCLRPSITAELQQWCE